ncbi:hypothetical protein NQ318_004287, partial [Aromia moschata]
MYVFEAFKNNDSILLRQIVGFFVDAVAQSKNTHILREYKQYKPQVEALLDLVDNNISHSSEDPESCSRDTNSPECISLLLEFIHSLMRHDIESLTHLHPKISRLAINWVNSDWVSFQALIILTKIVEKAAEEENDTYNCEALQTLVVSLPAFSLLLQSNALPSSMESCRRLGALLRLFRALLQAGSVRVNVLQLLKGNALEKVFVPLQSDSLGLECLPTLRCENGDVSSTDAVYTYLYGLALVNELAQHDASWLGMQSTLMENRKIHMIIAQALYGATSVKNLALEICRHPSLSVKKVASTMSLLQPMFEDVTETSTKRQQPFQEVGFTTLSSAQMEKFDDMLHQMKRLIEENNAGDIVTSKVMELFEYKLVTLAFAEKAALSSVEVATERMVAGQIKVLEGQLKGKEKALAECTEQLTERDRQVKDLSETVAKLKEQVAKKEQVINKLVESGNKSEKNLQKTEELLKKANADIKNLNS